jgi:hypothetical protein
MFPLCPQLIFFSYVDDHFDRDGPEILMEIYFDPYERDDDVRQNNQPFMSVNIYQWKDNISTHKWDMIIWTYFMSDFILRSEGSTM